MEDRRIKLKEIVEVNSHFVERNDPVVVEEPLEIRIKYGLLSDRRTENFVMTMRTPGNDVELAIGLLFSEGVISKPQDVFDVKFLENPNPKKVKRNVLMVELAPDVEFETGAHIRKFYSNSSCGLCGKMSIESLEGYDYIYIPDDDFLVDVDVIRESPAKLLSKQSLFSRTGGIHGAGIFDKDGNVVMLREDVGRHNALDKIIGAAFMKKMMPLGEYYILVSGRVGFELVQKSLAASLPMLLAIGAPTSLAIDLANEYNLSLIGFVKEKKFNVYSGMKRIKK